MLRSLILLIYCTGWAAAVTGDIVDDCNYYSSTDQTRCGDICIAANRNCICGGQKLFTKAGPNHCCVETSPINSQQCIDSNGYGICLEGRVLNKTNTCNGRCYNDYSASEQIGSDSYFRCGNQCVPVWRMCRGYSQCEDRSDVTACDRTLTCVFKKYSMYMKGYMKSGLSDQHFYCNYDDLKNNGKYDTINRVDETDLDIRRQKVRIDYTMKTEK